MVGCDLLGGHEPHHASGHDRGLARPRASDDNTGLKGRTNSIELFLAEGRDAQDLREVARLTGR
ncbi:unannotated protein [freshwater metagenome]|uniref:Unannotated protein n=1 Tax=freshwater metagenome TaxID=449393 RepID=A0A6J7C568_9ZZZZ